MEIFMVRHGETEWNRQRRLQGRTDIPLNDAGLAEARKAAKALRDVNFDRIFTSPLQRARKTAEILRGSREIPVTVEPVLIEVSFGVGEGLSIGRSVNLSGGDCRSGLSGSLADGAPGATKPSGCLSGERIEGFADSKALPASDNEAVRAAVLRFFRDPGHYEPVDGAESITEVKARALAFLDVLRPLEGSCERVLVTAHGGIIRAILDVIEELPDEEFWSGQLLPNCGAAVAELSDGKFTVKGIKDLVSEEVCIKQTQ